MLNMDLFPGVDLGVADKMDRWDTEGEGGARGPPGYCRNDCGEGGGRSNRFVAEAEANGLREDRAAGDECVAARGEEGVDEGLNSVKIDMAEGRLGPCLSLPLPSFVENLERLG